MTTLPPLALPKASLNIPADSSGAKQRVRSVHGHLNGQRKSRFEEDAFVTSFACLTEPQQTFVESDLIWIAPDRSWPAYFTFTRLSSSPIARFVGAWGTGTADLFAGFITKTFHSAGFPAYLRSSTGPKVVRRFSTSLTTRLENRQSGEEPWRTNCPDPEGEVARIACSYAPEFPSSSITVTDL